MILKLSFISLVITQVIYNVAALNILVIVSLPHKSHYMAFQNLFRELSHKGHKLTVINNYPEKDQANLKFINIGTPLRVHSGVDPMSNFEDLSISYAYWRNFGKHFLIGSTTIPEDCENFFVNKNMKAFRNKGEKFDLIFVEQFMSDCGLLYAGVMYDAPIIGITSHTLLPWAYPRLGIPFNAGLDAFYFCNAGTNYSLSQKVECFLMDLFMNTIGRWQIQERIYNAFKRHVPNIELDVEKIAKERMKMMFSYQHHAVTGARLLSPQVLEIGGIHIGKPKPLPEALEKFISSAEHGVVYVSFGSNLKTNTMSKHKLQQFLLAFKKVPQKFLFKLENMTLPSGNDNVFTHEWFPQLDVLCHPKVLAFVTQGGMLSLSEAAHCGKPLLAIPFFGDQFSNGAAITESGLGTTMHFKDINKDNLAEKIKYLTSQEMQESAQRVSKLWHDRPLNVMDSAIYWTEYVARHKDAPQALPSSRATWFQRSLLDVYSVLLGLILAILLLVYYVCKIIKISFNTLLRISVIKYSKGKKKEA